MYLFTDCNKVTNVGLQAVVRLPKIEFLSLEYLHNITDSALTYVPNLKKLFCKGCRHMKDDGICTLIKTCNLIEVLDLSFCSQITNTLVECAVNATKNRTNNIVLSLHLDGTSVDPDELHNDFSSPLLEMSLPFLSESSFGGSEYGSSNFSYYRSSSSDNMFEDGFMFEVTDSEDDTEDDSEEDKVESENNDPSEHQDVKDVGIADAN